MKGNEGKMQRNEKKMRGNDKKIYELLIKNKVYFSLRGEFIRFSIHFYNNQNDLENLVSILKEKKA